MSYLSKTGVFAELKRANQNLGINLEPEQITTLNEYLSERVLLLAKSKTFKSNLKKTFYLLDQDRKDGSKLIQLLIQIDDLEFIVEWTEIDRESPLVPVLFFPNDSWICLIEDADLAKWFYKMADQNPSREALRVFLTLSGYTEISPVKDEEDIDQGEFDYLLRFWKSVLPNRKIEGVQIEEEIKQFLLNEM